MSPCECELKRTPSALNLSRSSDTATLAIKHVKQLCAVVVLYSCKEPLLEFRRETVDLGSIYPDMS